ncbi:fibronectin type III domain-containing protein [Flaviaesturariibacter amylovorans]|uniref:Fibronectin type-III domain-containing protein n=1 Tax=Flaviaesturariibacter amylovorans TaxID=1084520 RepID=A0ABP8HW92_9BACT
MFPIKILPIALALLIAGSAHAAGGTPPSPSSALQVTARGNSSFSLSWTPGTGERRIVVLRPVPGSANVAPQNGVTYPVADSGNYTAAGNPLTGAANRVVYEGTGSSLTIRNLAAGSTYAVAVYDYTGSGSATEYSMAATLGSVSTLAAAPTGQLPGSAIAFGGIGAGNSIRLDYAAASTVAGANGYLLLVKEGRGVALQAADLPQDGTAYTAGSVLGAATVAAVVTSSSQSSSTITGLRTTGQYTFFWVPFAGSQASGTNSFHTSGTMGSLYVPSFSGTAASAGGESASISSLLNTVAISTGSDGVQVWQLALSESGDDDTLPTLVRSLTLTASSSNQLSFATAIQDVALFREGVKVDGSVSLTATQLQFSGIGNLAVPDNGSLTLSLRLSVKPNVNGGASTGANRDGDRFAFQLSFSNIGCGDAEASSQFGSFAAIASAAAGANIYSVSATAIRFAQAPPASTDPYRTLLPAPAVEAVDAGGNRDIDHTAPVTLSVTGPALAGTLTRTALSGLATFTGLYFSGPGAAVLTAGSGAFSTAPAPVAVADVSILGVYTFTGTSCTAPSLAAQSLAGAISFGSIGTSGIGCNNNASPAGTVFSGSATWSTSFDASRYVQFSASPATGYTLHATALAFEIFRSANGATHFAVRGSADGFASDLLTGTTGTVATAVALPLPATYLGQGAVSFRIYGWGGTSGDLRLDNIALRGNAGYTVSTADFRTSTGGDYFNPSIWEFFDGRAWVAAGAVPASAPRILISEGHSVELGGDLALTGTQRLLVAGLLDARTHAIGGSGTLEVSGTLRTAHPGGLAGTFTAGNPVLDSGSTVEYRGAGQPVGLTDFYHLDLAGAVSPQFSDSFGIRGSLVTGMHTSIPATVIFKGTTPQSVPGGTYGGLRINNAYGAWLSGAVRVAGALELSSGLLMLGHYGLSADSIRGGSGASFVVTNGSGLLERRSVAGTVLLPVGAHGGSYSPLTIGSAEGLHWRVRVQDDFTGYGAIGSGNPLPRVWEVTPSAAPAVPADLGFSWSDGPGTSISVMNVYHHAAGRWELLPNGTGVPVQQSGTMRTLTLPGQTAFSPFALAAPATALPVTFLRFTGRRLPDRNELRWTTASEAGNRGFRVERSGDGRFFGRVGYVASGAPNGTSSALRDYSFSDRPPHGQRWYYRLVQEDLDGRERAGSVLMIAAAGQEPLIVEGAFPNPARERITVRLRGAAAAGAELHLVDAGGRLLRRWALRLPAGGRVAAPLRLNGLPAGRYYLGAAGAVDALPVTILGTY